MSVSVRVCLRLCLSVSDINDPCPFFILFFKNRRLLQADEADKWSSYEDGEKHATNKEKTSAVQRNGSFCGETGFSATVLMGGGKGCDH